jgi:PEGA domain
MTITTRPLLAALCLTSVLTGCASETVLRTNVPNTKVFIDGAYVGVTPYTMRDTKIVGSTTAIRLEAPGYAPTMVAVHRDEKFSVAACIGGVFLLVPFLWIMGYNSEHTFELQRGGGGIGAR